MAEKLNILVVDDDETMRDLLIDILTDAGYEAKAVSNGEKAITEIKANDYDIMITDLRMPGVNGVEVVKEVRRIKDNICIIVFTGYPSVESAVEVMREGAYDYIAKPFDIEEIRLVIHRAAERHYLSEEVKQKEFLQKADISDGLTGLYTHRHFYEVFLREIERAKRYSQLFSLLLLDIDNFKSYNDANGYLAGDQLLVNIAKLLLSTTRHVDIAFRYSGEEFVIILPQVDKTKAAKAAKRILNLTEQRLSVTISGGVVSFPDDGATKDELINKLNSAVNKAKHLGKGRIYVTGEENEK